MKVLIAGDFVPRNRTVSLIEVGDYSCIDNVKPIIQSADYSIVNFESPVVTRLANPIVKAGPNLKCTEKAMECIAQNGFRCVTLANNHFRDYGHIGVEDTIEACKKYNLDYVGGGRNIQEAVQTLYKTIDGQTVAIVNFCENEWSIATEFSGGSSPLNIVQNYYTITEAKKHADYVLVIVHGGIEGYEYPTPRMQETYRFFIESGADAVINHHQHCYSGYEEYKGKPIFYGLGNFCFDLNNNDKKWLQGYMVIINIEKANIKYELYPYIQCADVPKTILMNAEEKTCFLANISRINSIIIEKQKLQNQFNIISSRRKNSKLLEFEPFGNKYIKYLQLKKIIPSFISKKTKRDIYDLINCESHREIVLNIFNSIYNVNK